MHINTFKKLEHKTTFKKAKISSPKAKKATERGGGLENVYIALTLYVNSPFKGLWILFVIEKMEEFGHL